MNINKEAIQKIEDFILKKKKLSSEFLQEYIMEYIETNQLNHLLKQIIFTEKSSGYMDEFGMLFIGQNYLGERQKAFLQACNLYESNALQIMFTLYMVHHELQHINQTETLKKNKHADAFFLEQLKISNDICELDINFLNKINYNKFHDYFLFEANANITAIIETLNIMEQIEASYPKDIYNQYSAHIITHQYHNQICPIAYSNRLCNRIINNLKQLDSKKYDCLEAQSINQQSINKDAENLYDILLHGYELPDTTYEYLFSVAQGKIKTKSLFSKHNGMI